MRPNQRMDTDDLAMARVFRRYEERPRPRRYNWDLLSYWALALLFTVCITLAAS